MRGHSHKGIYWITKILAVPSTVNSAVVTEHVVPTAEAIGKQQDVGMASWRDRKGAEVTNTDGDTWIFRWRHGDDWPADSQP